MSSEATADNKILIWNIKYTFNVKDAFRFLLNWDGLRIRIYLIWYLLLRAREELGDGQIFIGRALPVWKDSQKMHATQLSPVLHLLLPRKANQQGRNSCDK